MSTDKKTPDKEEAPSPDTAETTKKTATKPEEKKKRDPIKIWTAITVALCIAIFVGHILADKFTPYTSNGRIEAYIVPIVPEVSGTLTKVYVNNNQFVSEG